MSAPKPNTPKTVAVELLESETIRGRGRRTEIYEVALNDGWVAASTHPKARVEALDARAGTVWERRVELELAIGTRVDRVVSEPMPTPRRDALEHLQKGRQKAERRIRRTELRVGRRGTLLPLPERRPG